MAIKNIKMPGSHDAVPVGTQIYPGTREEWNALSMDEKVKWDYTAFDDDEDDVPEDAWAQGVNEKLEKALYNHGEQRVDKDFSLVFDDMPDGGLKFIGGTIKGFRPGSGWIPDDGYNYPGEVPDIPMVKKAIDSETTPYAKLFTTSYGPPTNASHPDNQGLTVGQFRICVESRSGSFIIYKCTKIENGVVTWTPLGDVHKSMTMQLSNNDMPNSDDISEWCAWIYEHVARANGGDWFGSIGHFEFYTDMIPFSNDTQYTGYMTVHLTQATDYGGDYPIHGFGMDDAGNVYRIYADNYDEDYPQNSGIYAEKMTTELERKVIDLKPYLNMTIVDKVQEYVRATITGKQCIIDIGGVCFKSSANAQVFLSGLPFKIKNRAVVSIFRDSSQGSATNVEYCTLYTTMGGNTISIHCRTANPYYGQMVIELV